MIKLLIAEDQVLVCEALASLLNMEDDLDVVGTARDGEEAVNLALSLRPDVALVDIEMPKLSGLDVVQVLQNQLPQCRTIVLTTFARPGYLQRAVKSGASGYLLKDAQVEELADAKRELDVLRLAARGLSTRDIAAQSYLSEGTVRNYLSEIMSKLNVQTRQEAVKIATEKGWL
jgi:two-component system response regulator DesR